MTEIGIEIVTGIETGIVIGITTVETEEEIEEGAEVMMMMTTVITAVRLVTVMAVEQQSHLLHLLCRSQVLKYSFKYCILRGAWEKAISDIG